MCVQRKSARARGRDAQQHTLYKKTFTPQAPAYSLEFDGGNCKAADNGTVMCASPKLSLTLSSATCSLPYRSAGSLVVRAIN